METVANGQTGDAMVSLINFEQIRAQSISLWRSIVETGSYSGVDNISEEIRCLRNEAEELYAARLSSNRNAMGLWVEATTRTVSNAVKCLAKGGHCCGRLTPAEVSFMTETLLCVNAIYDDKCCTSNLKASSSAQGQSLRSAMLGALKTLVSAPKDL